MKNLNGNFQKAWTEMRLPGKPTFTDMWICQPHHQPARCPKESPQKAWEPQTRSGKAAGKRAPQHSFVRFSPTAISLTLLLFFHLKQAAKRKRKVLVVAISPIKSLTKPVDPTKPATAKMWSLSKLVALSRRMQSRYRRAWSWTNRGGLKGSADRQRSVTGPGTKPRSRSWSSSSSPGARTRYPAHRLFIVHICSDCLLFILDCSLCVCLYPVPVMLIHFQSC